MKKYILPLFLCLIAACSDSDDSGANEGSSVNPTENMMIVVNQGSYYDGIDGTLTAVDLQDGTTNSNVFAAANNGISLGGSPQAATLSGNLLYIPVFESNLVWVVEAASLKVKHQIQVNNPQNVVVANSIVFVSGNDGFLNCYDAISFELIKRIEVGPNPCHMVQVGNKLYISISDGYNYPTYENGYRLAQVDMSALQLDSYINVEMNPGPLCATEDGQIYVVCRGDYSAITSKVLKVNPATKDYKYICEGSFITLGNNQLYVINLVTDWTTYESHTYYQSYDLATDSLVSDRFIADTPQPALPNSIHCSDNGDLFITSNAGAYDYTSPGYVYHYTSDGTHQATYPVGVAPCGIVFNN